MVVPGEDGSQLLEQGAGRVRWIHHSEAKTVGDLFSACP
ncbi:MAG: hypothetical protein ACI8RZ_003110, partial [Myxococcota bacterium]